MDFDIELYFKENNTWKNRKRTYRYSNSIGIYNMFVGRKKFAQRKNGF